MSTSTKKVLSDVDAFLADESSDEDDDGKPLLQQAADPPAAPPATPAPAPAGADPATAAAADDAEIPRRFEPKKKLVSEGKLKRGQIITLLRDCGSMLMSEETTDLYREAIASQKDMSHINKMAVQWQLEFFESRGFERNFTNTCLKNIQEDFKNDQEIIQELMKFARTCQLSIQKAAQPKVDDLPESERRFKPAAKLQSDGKLTKKQYLEFFTKCTQMMMSKETVGLLRAGRASTAGVGTPEDRTVVNKKCIRWQRETFESLGIQADFGIQCLCNLYSDPLFKDPQVNMAFQSFPRACEMAVEQAMRKEVPLRFPKKEPLQTEGPLTKAQVLEFFAACNAMLMSAETVALIGEAQRNKEDFGQMSIAWQWQIFESLGIEHELGVRSLMTIPQKYSTDLKMKTEFVRFQQMCQMSAMKGTGMDTSHYEEVIKDLGSIMEEVSSMTMDGKKKLIARIVPKLQQVSQSVANPMEIMGQLETAQDRRDYFTMVCMKTSEMAQGQAQMRGGRGGGMGGGGR